MDQKLTDWHVRSLSIISYILIHHVLGASCFIQWLLLGIYVDKCRWKLHYWILNACTWKILMILFLWHGVYIGASVDRCCTI